MRKSSADILLPPRSVPVKTLGEIATVETGEQLNKSKLTASGKFPVMNGGITPSGFYHDFNTPENSIAISQGGASAGFVNFLETKFWAGAHCFVVVPATNQIETKFLFYTLKNRQTDLMNCKRGAGIPGLNRKDVLNFPVPVPSLAEQRRIVGILDKFTALEAELAARKKQYAYYRERLLSFENGGGLPFP